MVGIKIQYPKQTKRLIYLIIIYLMHLNHFNF